MNVHKLNIFLGKSPGLSIRFLKKNPTTTTKLKLLKKILNEFKVKKKKKSPLRKKIDFNILPNPKFGTKAK